VKRDFWQESSVPVISGEIVKEVKAVNGALFVRSYGATTPKLYKSSDLGTGWQAVNITQNIGGSLYGMDADEGKLYIATRNGILVSGDQGASFTWSLSWTWDGSTSVDMQNGYGWASIASWGSLSGPIRKTPQSSSWTLCRGDIPWSAMSASSAVADPLDPYNIAYIRNAGGGYRTVDSGLHWTVFPYAVIYTANINGKSVIYTQTAYSDNHGDTWNSLGVTAAAIIRDEATGLYFAAPIAGGIYVGQPGAWHAYGLSEHAVKSLSICSGKLFVVTSAGKVFSTKDDIANIALLY
jgi:hypothetical protein